MGLHLFKFLSVQVLNFFEIDGVGLPGLFQLILEDAPLSLAYRGHVDVLSLQFLNLFVVFFILLSHHFLKL